MVKKLHQYPCPRNQRFKIAPYLSGDYVYIHCRGFETCKDCPWYGETNPSISQKEIQRLEKEAGFEGLELESTLSPDLLKMVTERIMRGKEKRSQF